MNKTFSVVNHSLPKIDALGLIQGKPAYTDDLAPGDALVVKLLRSPHAFAKILSIDKSQALALEGVACVLDWRDVPRIPYTRAGQGHPEPSPHDRFILDRFVRFVGDEVAVVAAETEAVALKALSLIKVEYEILEPLLDFEAATDNPLVLHPEPEIHDMFPIGFEPKRNIAAAYAMELGDIEKELAFSDIVLSRSFKTQAQAHVAMEPHAAFAYLDIHQRLVIYTSTQNPFHTRRLLGQALDFPLSRIRVVKPRIGGGFGGKQQIHVEPFVSLVCLATGRAARCSLTRREVFEATFCRHQMRIDMRIGASKNGRINAIDMQILSNTGAYGEHALTVFMVGGSKTLPLYNKLKAVRFGGKVVYTNTRSAGAFRGYGAIQGNFALESMIDELAHALAMDPVKLRSLNMVREGESSDVYRVMGEGREGVDMVFESCKLEYCVARGRELIGWDAGPLAREIAPGKIRAKGMAIAMQGSGIPLVDMGSAFIELQDGGCFKLRVGATDLGTGSDTILAQIAAQELGVPFSSINVYASDTDHTPFDVGAYASSTTYVSGNAVLSAAKKMKAILIEAVAQRHGISNDDVRFDGEKFHRNDGSFIQDLNSLSLDTLYHDGEKMTTLCAAASFSGPKSPPPYVAGFTEIDLDSETGKIDVVRYIAVVDCGVPINPALARIQVEGGVLQGIGMALFENVRYDAKGRLMTNSLRSYTIPSREDIGSIVVEFAESYEPSGPFGAKSVAEVSIDSPPAAIANAIFNAAGIRLTETPFTPERVLKALQELKA
ncbi:MAG: molybdopterin-dependent oxidoreductase [Spirochaetia bacterium]|jgi:CO/xanthine dehydrogenase Mo-binding subunit|nr:molybdopterin-dependent oxidoreductase [Spirochaetia bacterium]